eukprot:87339_1
MEFLADQYSSRDARKSVWLSRLRTLNGWFSDYYTLPGIHITDNAFYDKIYVPFGEWDVHEDTIQDIVMSCKTIDLTVEQVAGVLFDLLQYVLARESSETIETLRIVAAMLEQVLDVHVQSDPEWFEGENSTAMFALADIATLKVNDNLKKAMAQMSKAMDGIMTKIYCVIQSDEKRGEHVRDLAKDVIDDGAYDIWCDYALKLDRTVIHAMLQPILHPFLIKVRDPLLLRRTNEEEEEEGDGDIQMDEHGLPASSKPLMDSDEPEQKQDKSRGRPRRQTFKKTPKPVVTPYTAMMGRNEAASANFDQGHAPYSDASMRAFNKMLKESSRDHAQSYLQDEAQDVLQMVSGVMDQYPSAVISKESILAQVQLTKKLETFTMVENGCYISKQQLN